MQVKISSLLAVKRHQTATRKSIIVVTVDCAADVLDSKQEELLLLHHKAHSPNNGLIVVDTLFPLYAVYAGPSLIY